MNITISYAPAVKIRRSSTLALRAAIRTLKANPRDQDGNPGSFTVDKRYRGSVRTAASDVGAEVVTRTTEDGQIQVFLKGNDPAEPTAVIPGILDQNQGSAT